MVLTIHTHVKHSHLRQALQVCDHLLKHKTKLDSYDFVSILKAFTFAESLFHGRLIHGYLIMSYGLDQNLYVGNALIHMYMKCGGVMDAFYVFHDMSSRDIVTWNSMLFGYVNLDKSEMALCLWKKMHQDMGVNPDKYTFVCILKACSTLGYIMPGKLVHCLIVEYGLECDVYVRSSLVDMYASCGSIHDAQNTFIYSSEKILVMWNALISGYSWNVNGDKAIEYFLKMQHEGHIPTQVTFVCTLRACSHILDFQLGMQVHTYIIELSYDLNVFIESALIDMYAQSWCFNESLHVFSSSAKQDNVTWGALISGFVRCGQHGEAMFHYRNMKDMGFKITETIYVCVVKACSNLRAIEHGKMIHIEIIAGELQSVVYVANALIDMYASCGYLKEAQMIFDDISERDIVSWNSLLAGYACHCHDDEIFGLFYRMQKEGIDPDTVTIICIIKACTKMMALDKGKYIHGYLKIKEGLYDSNAVRNALIDMYNKCGSLSHAEAIFNIMPAKDAVTWSTMMAGFLEHGHAKEAISLFLKMLQEGTHPNQGVLVTVLKACSDETDLHFGKLVHALILDSSFDNDTVVSNTLIHMYAIGGKLEDACMVFQTMPDRNQVTWTSIISGFFHSNDVKSVSRYFLGMKRGGFKPNDVTLVCLLSAYSHDGLLEEACDLFSSMMEDPNVYLKVEHYNCVVDILGRENMLDQGKELLISMPFHLNLVGWKSLLKHCKTFGHVELGRECFNNIIALDVGNSFAYALMVDIYVDAGMWEDVNQLQVKQGERELQKFREIKKG